MFGRLNKNKKITVFGLSLKESPKKFFTICNSPDECREHLSLLIKCNCYEHFQMWCETHDLDSKEKSSWDKYYSTCITNEEKNNYIIVPMKFAWKDLLAIVRMFGGYVPLGASFDTEAEYVRLKHVLDTEEKYQKIFEEYMKLTEENKEVEKA